MVSTSSSSTSSIQVSSAPEAPRWRQDSRSRRLVSVTSRGAELAADLPQPRGVGGRGAPESPSSETSRATQVGACTPLVIEPIGTSAVSKPGPQPGEHLAADLAVQHGNAVDPLGEPHAHHGHVEHVRVPARVGLRAEREHPVQRQRSPAASSAKYRSMRSRGKPVDAGGHRRVGGEDGAGAAQLERLVEGQPGRRVLADPLEAEEAGVALVGVEHLGLGVAGDRAEGAHGADAADAEQQLLAEPVLAAAAVQPVGDLVQRGLVLLHVGVEQQQRHPADLGQPDLGGEQLAAGQGHADHAPGRRRPGRAAG